MIVSREYIPFKKLIDNYDKAGTLFVELCKKSYPADMWAKALLDLSEYALFQREMEWGFHGIGKLIEGFQKIDAEEPFETGYDISDACHADIIRCDADKVTLLLRTDSNHGNDVVGVITVDIPK